jgi:hypothetical protein
MSCKFPPIKNLLKASFLSVILSIFITGGCTVKAAKEDEKTIENLTSAAQSAQDKSSKNKIEIAPDSPAETVRVFYKNLREKKFRDALFLTNLRPAIEGLTDAELKDLQVDFARLASQIPAEININGEIIVGDEATVTAKLPDNETENLQLQQIRLRRSGNVWTILTVDEEAEKIIRKEGRNYFFHLKIETHQAEARKMLNRIAKAQMIYSTQNKGVYGDLSVLAKEGFLPADALSADSTGYNYKISLSSDRKSYTATAEPAVYGKTGKLSFAFTVTGDKTSALKSVDNKGKPFGNR